MLDGPPASDDRLFSIRCFVRRQNLIDGGVTDCMTMPWMYYSGREATIDQKIECMTRFADDVIRPLVD